MIKSEFIASLKKYTADSELHHTLWKEVEKNYSDSGRHYHTLTHLDAMLNELRIHKDKFRSWDTIIFAITYHDIIYSSIKSDNEERSADVAVKRLTAISFPEALITFCRQLIVATKKHEPADAETNLFTDADLSILGADPTIYKEYTQQIRSEYSIYPDILYNPGRKKVLTHFLAMNTIYKTKVFADKYEPAARINIQTELTSLSN